MLQSKKTKLIPEYGESGQVIGFSVPLSDKTACEQAVKMGGRIIPNFDLPYILETCDTVRFSTENLEWLLSSTKAKTIPLDYVMEHLPFNEVVLRRDDGRIYYFYRSQNDLEDWDFVIGYGETKDLVVMTAYCYDKANSGLWQALLPDMTPPVWICDNTSHVRILDREKAVEFYSGIKGELNQKLNSVLTLLYALSMIPKQYVKRSEIKKKVKIVERKGNVKKKLFKKIIQTIVIIDNNESRCENRQTECEYTAKSWGVRGHYRHYKSGKVVWIEPHTLHRAEKLLSNRSVDKQSIYTFGGFDQ